MIGSSVNTSLPRRISRSPRRQVAKEVTHQIGIHGRRHCPDRRDNDVHVVELSLHAF